MNKIRNVFAENLKKLRHSRGFSQAKLAEKARTSTHYIGMLETMNKFPSSEMIEKLSEALDIDPTELFNKEIDPMEVMKRCQKAAYSEAGEATKHFLEDFVSDKLRELESTEA
jgi:transcriptional regulator with XRE-family HTH domain